MYEQIKNELKKVIPPELVNELFVRYDYLKKKFLEGYFDPSNFEPSELNSGKFTEVVLRILQYLVSNTYTPLARRLDFSDALEQQFLNATASDSVRLHIPRALRSVYDVRNRRGVGHVNNEINPNVMDSVFVVSVCSWVLAEIIRIYANTKPEDAQLMIERLTERNVPLFWNFENRVVLLDTKLGKEDGTLLFLLSKGSEGSSLEEVEDVLSVSTNRAAGVLGSLKKKRYVVKSKNSGNFFITPTGASYAEGKIRV